MIKIKEICRLRYYKVDAIIFSASIQELTLPAYFPQKDIGEKCKVSIRNIRREANDELKKMLKSKEISEDDEKKYEKKIQTITDDNIKKIDEKVTTKENEIMKI